MGAAEGRITFEGEPLTLDGEPVLSGTEEDVELADALAGAGIGLNFASVTVSSAEILDLHNTPKTLIAAPGAGKYISVIDIKPMLNWNSAAYTGDGSPFIVYAGTAHQIMGAGILLTEPQDMAYFVNHLNFETGGIDIQGVDATNVENKALVLTADDPLTDGNSPMVFDIFYRIVDLP